MDNLTSAEWILQNGNSFDSRADCIRECSLELDISLRSARKAMKKLEDTNQFTIGAIKDNESNVVHDSNKIAHIELVNKVPTTVEDLVAISKLDAKIWEISKGRAGFWGNENNPNYQVRVEFKRKISEAGQAFLEEIKNSIRDFAPNYPKLNYTRTKESGYLLELSLYDLHLGLVTENYNPKVAIDRYFTAISRLLDWYSNKPIDRIVLVIGNDFFNANDRHGNTVKLNPRDDSPRWKDTYKKGFNTLVKSIDLCQSIAPVDIVVVEGNHDADRIFYAAHALEAWYANCPQVEIYNDSNDFQFYKWKKNLLGFTHGDACKLNELPMIMATGCDPKDWADSEFRMWRTGHKHHGKTTDYLSRPVSIGDELHGVRVMMSPGLCDRSTWELWKGYKSIKEAVGTLWSATEGDISTYGFKI